MGIYDRDYFRDEQPQGFFLGGQWSAVGTIVFLNVIVFFAASFTKDYHRPTPDYPPPYPASSPVNRALALHSDLFEQLYVACQHYEFWQLWKVATLLTSGFAHDVESMWHILGNMFIFWILGRDVEGIYGKRLFMRMYLSLVVTAGLGWMALTNLVGQPASVIGASGAVTGVLLLFVLHFPKRTILLFFVLPVPAWVLGVFWLGGDLLGYNANLLGLQSTNVAYGGHLAGAFFGFVFYRWHWTLFTLLPMGWLSKVPRRSRGAKLRVVRDEPEGDEEENLDAEVDRILAKISRLGTDSLTDEEHHTLEVASRRAQRRRGVHMD